LFTALSKGSDDSRRTPCGGAFLATTRGLTKEAVLPPTGRLASGMPTDYFLRLLEMLQPMLIEIDIKRAAGGLDGAREEIEKACLRITGLSFDLLRHNSPEALFDLMQRGTDPYQKSILLAELFIQHAKINEEEGNTADEIGDTLQAYCLISNSIGVLDAEEKAVYDSKLELLAQKLSAFKDNPYIQQRLKPRPETNP
jgi:hypothetical protein